MSDSLLSHSQMSTLLNITFIIVVIGAINWYTTVVMHRNLVSTVIQKQDGTDLTKTTKNEKIIYALIGISGIVLLYGYFTHLINMQVLSSTPHW